MSKLQQYSDSSVCQVSDSEHGVSESSTIVSTHPMQADSLIFESLPKVEYFPASKDKNCLTAHLHPALSYDDIKLILRRRGIEKDETVGTSQKEKVSALSRHHFAYNPSPQAIAFAQKILETVRDSLTLRDPAQPNYERFIHQIAETMGGGPVHTMPNFSQSFQGYGFVLAGPSGVGRSAFLQRLHGLIGRDYKLVHPHGTRSMQMIFVPMVFVMWPQCGTLNGFLTALRDAIRVSVGSSIGSQILKNFTGKSGQQIAISICILFNVGLLVVDGAGMQSLRGEYGEIFQFISRVQKQAGIPILISCTYPIAQVISRLGGDGANLANIAAEYWDLLQPGRQWSSYCEFFWNIGASRSEEKIPSFLAQKLWDTTYGNLRICSQAILAVHHAMADELAAGQHPALTESRATTILEKRLRFFVEPLKVLSLYHSEGYVPRDDLYTFGDYLPYTAFQNTPSGEFERRARSGSNTRLQLHNTPVLEATSKTKNEKSVAQKNKTGQRGLS